MFGGGFANVKHYREGKVRYYLSFGRAKYRVPDLPRRVWALRLSMKALKVRSWPAGIDVCLSISLLLFMSQMYYFFQNKPYTLLVF